MGNVLAQPTKLQLDLLAEVPNVVYKDTLSKWVVRPSCLAELRHSRLSLVLGAALTFALVFVFASDGGRFLKTLLCVHDEGGLVVVKVRNRQRHPESMASLRPFAFNVALNFLSFCFCFRCTTSGPTPRRLTPTVSSSFPSGVSRPPPFSPSPKLDNHN